MNRRSSKRFAAGLVVAYSTLASAFCPAAEPPLARHSFTQMQMGAEFKLVFYAADPTAANRAAAAAFARIAELNKIMSDYDPQSELMRLCGTAGRGEPVGVSPDLWLVLARSQSLAEQSDGAFDITVGPLVRLWRRARREREMPSPERLAAARQLVGYRLLKLDTAQRTVELTKEGMRLDLGGIAAGYAADEALAVLAGHGFTRALVDASGDLVAGDPPPDKAGWRIGIAPLDAKDAPPSRFVALAHAAISTSGDTWQHVELAGVRYSHIVDPHTGLGLTDRASVTIVAPDCITADSLATAVSVLGPQRGMQLVEASPDVAAVIVRVIDGKIETYESARMKRLVDKQAAAASAGSSN